MQTLLVGLTQAEDEFYRFEKWSGNHDDLDEEVEKYAKERDCQENYLIFLQSQEKTYAGNNQQAD
ncbi:hypothetical protein [Mesobacillus boroniphilus]|uniref:hypothetical protein n=1 Tax=Mesobacillus boroniphilus TaxID=308892 RepID=UPI001BCE31C1|nr:hypothetical protein [Mesobacillus boroniphilus]